MANAGMRAVGAKAIAAAFCANTTLETVDLSGNDFVCRADENASDSAAESLSFGLQVTTTPKRRMGERGQVAVRTAGPDLYIARICMRNEQGLFREEGLNVCCV